MKLLAAILGLMILTSVPARATEWMICADGDKASFSVLLGAMEVIAVNDIRIEAGGMTWSTTPGEGGDVVSGGTLRMPDVGAWAVTCSGP